VPVDGNHLTMSMMLLLSQRPFLAGNKIQIHEIGEISREIDQIGEHTLTFYAEYGWAC
jgi:hypothetical protein